MLPLKWKELVLNPLRIITLCLVSIRKLLNLQIFHVWSLLLSSILNSLRYHSVSKEADQMEMKLCDDRRLFGWTPLAVPLFFGVRVTFSKHFQWRQPDLSGYSLLLECYRQSHQAWLLLRDQGCNVSTILQRCSDRTEIILHSVKKWRQVLCLFHFVAGNCSSYSRVCETQKELCLCCSSTIYYKYQYKQ